MEELGDDIPSSIHFGIGYYEKRSSKCWLVTAEDLKLMYTTLKSEEILLWCDAETHDEKQPGLMGKARKEMAYHQN